MSTGTPDVPVHDGLRAGGPLLERGDAELLAASRTGDQEAYAELFRRHAPAATALARRLTGHPSDADDLVSEAFTKVLAALKNGNGPTSALRPYLLTAVRRVHVDRAVAAQRVQPTDDIGAHDPGVPFVDSALAGLERSMVAQAYQQLPERWQMVLWHTEVEELSPKDIAPLLGMSANAVAALALRARAGLREAYLAAHVTTTSSPECERMLPKLAAYVRGSAAARERAAVERHLPGCEDCRAVLAELQDVGGRMRAVIGPLILGTAASGYIADIALLPAIGAPAALAAAGAAPAAGGAGATAAGGNTAVGAGGTGGAATAGGAAGAGAGMAGVGGWLVGAAAALIVVGAVAGAVTLSQNGDPAANSGGRGTSTASSASGAGSSPGGVPGAGAEPSATGSPPAGSASTAASAPSSTGTGPVVVGPQAAGPATPQPISNRAGAQTPTPPAATNTPAPAPAPGPAPAPAPAPAPTTPPTATAPPVPPVFTPPATTPPVVPPPVVPPPAVTPPPVETPIDNAPRPNAPTVSVAPTGAQLTGSTDAGITLTFPAPTDRELTVSVQLPAPLTALTAGGCVRTPTGAECTVPAGASDVRVPVQVGVVTQAGEVAVPVFVDGTNLTRQGSTVTVSLVPGKAAPTVSLSDTPVLTGGTDAAVTVTFPAPTDQDLTLEVTLPAPLTLRPGSGCSSTGAVVTCPVPTGTQVFPLPVTIGAVAAATDLPITGQVSGSALLPTPVAGSVKVVPAAVNGALNPVNSWSGQVSSQVVGGSWLRNGNQGSSAELALTGPVRFARLYWAGQNDRGPLAESMQLTGPDGTTHSVLASRTTDLQAAGAQARSFVSYADVTSLLTQSGQWTGAATNRLTGNGNADFAGWMLVVVQDDPRVVNDTVALLDGGVVLAPQAGFTSYTTEASMGARTANLLAFGAGNGSGDTVSIGDQVVVTNGFNSAGLGGTNRGVNLVTVPVAKATQPLRVDAGNETLSLTAMIVTR